MKTLLAATNLRQIHALALAGAIGALFGLYLYVELVRTETIWLRDALAGVAIGGTIGFFLNASSPLRDGAWLKLARESTWGALAGAAGGALGLVVGELVLGGFQGGLAGRAVSWGILGVGIGASQGAAGWSRQRLIFGLLGGTTGGLVGGFLFEMLRKGMGDRYDLGQGLGIVLLGAGLGLFLAVVEQALRRAWVEVVRGRQEGRAYLLAGTRSTLGLDEKATVGLFGDATVARQHARIDARGRDYWIESLVPAGQTRVNGVMVGTHQPMPLKDGDRVELGNTLLVFRRR
jgi:hypothetical protein